MARKGFTITNTLMVAGGGLLGAGVALLVAPRSGKDTRREIARFTRNTGEKTERAVHELVSNISGYAGTVGEKASRLLKSGRCKIEMRGHRMARWIGGICG